MFPSLTRGKKCSRVGWGPSLVRCVDWGWLLWEGAQTRHCSMVHAREPPNLTPVSILAIACCQEWRGLFPTEMVRLSHFFFRISSYKETGFTSCFSGVLSPFHPHLPCLWTLVARKQACTRRRLVQVSRACLLATALTAFLVSRF